MSALQHLIKHPEPDNTVRTTSMTIAAERSNNTASESPGSKLSKLSVAISNRDFIDRIVRPAEQVIITGRSLASIWRDQQAGTYPPSLRIGQNAVGVKLSSLMAWLDSREVITADNVVPVAPGCSTRGRKKSLKAEV